MPVSVAPPIAKRVTQWDEYSGRFEAVRLGRGARPRLGLHRQAAFQGRPARQCRRPAVHHRQAAVRDRRRSADADVARNKAQVDLAELQVQRGASLIASRTITEARRTTSARPTSRSRRPSSRRPRRRCARRAQPRLDRRARADRRPHLRPQGRCRQPDPGRPAGRHLARHHRHLDPIHFVFDVSESDYLRYHAPLPAGRAAPPRAIHPVRIRLADETEWTRTGKVDFVDNRAEPALGHHPHPRRRRKQGPAADARHLRPRPALRRRVRCAADPRLRPSISDQARKIVFTVGDDNVVRGQAGDAGSDRRRPARRARRASARPTRWCSTGSPTRWCGRAPRSCRKRARSPPPKPSKPVSDSAHAFFPLLHRPADLRVGPVDHHPDRRRHRPARPADRGISRDRPAHRQHHRDLSRRLGRGHRRDRRHADRAGDQRRRRHALHRLAVDRRRAAVDQRRVQARRRHRPGAGAGAEPRRRRRSRACPRTCSGSASWCARPRPT